MTRPLALVTGGSAGIGLEIARLLAQDGHDLIISGSSARVDDAAKDLRKTGVDVCAIRSDLGTEDGNAALIAAVQDRGGVLDTLVLNAGIAIGGNPFLDVSLDKQIHLVGLNILSPMRLVHALTGAMVRKGSGRIMLVSSLSAFSPTPFESVYGPSKAFLSSFGYGIREELSGTGVSVTILHPGATATEFHARAGMGETGFGDNSWKNDPREVAQQGYDGMLRGDASVVGGDARTQEAGRTIKSIPEEDKARRHAERARLR